MYMCVCPMFVLIYSSFIGLLSYHATVPDSYLCLGVIFDATTELLDSLLCLQAVVYTLVSTKPLS